jgi:hypothetical protein
MDDLRRSLAGLFRWICLTLADAAGGEAKPPAERRLDPDLDDGTIPR